MTVNAEADHHLGFSFVGARCLYIPGVVMPNINSALTWVTTLVALLHFLVWPAETASK